MRMILTILIPFFLLVKGYTDEKGRQLYETNCMACHGKNLEGATGVPLIDNQWNHGSSALDIEKSIKNGFLLKGMPAFSKLLKEDEIVSIRKYILSHQEGLRELKYHFYKWKGEKIPDFKKLKESKKGSLPLNIIDLKKSHIKENTASIFKAKLYIKKSDIYKFKLSADEGAKVYLNGELVLWQDGLRKKLQTVTGKAQMLKAGIYDFEVHYFNAMGNYSLNISLIDSKGRNLALTSEGIKRTPSRVIFRSLKKQKGILVSRHHLQGTPLGSLNISFPSGINCNINPADLKVSKIWKGTFINLGRSWNHRGGASATISQNAVNEPIKSVHFKGEKTSPFALSSIEKINRDTLKIYLLSEGKIINLLITGKSANKLTIKYESKSKINILKGDHKGAQVNKDLVILNILENEGE